MRIVLDLQGAQTSGSRNRGIGRYSTALAKAILRNAGEHEVHLALNGAFADTIAPIREEFAALIPTDRIHVWPSVSPVNQIDPANRRLREAAQLCRTAFLANLKPDIVHVTSLFEGFGDDAVGSVERDAPFATSITLYDLIPLINADPYLSNPLVAQWYHTKLDQIRRSDLLLAISDSSRQEALTLLGFDEERVVNVGTAADDHFGVRSITEARKAELFREYSIDRPFVMYTGGIDLRKNIEALIESYSRLSRGERQKYQLAIVCSVQPAERDRLQSLARSHGVNDLVMTGFVPEDDLIDLYNLCELFVFPSWHEGFGLPALEAMWCDAPVIGSNRSSVPEVIGLTSALFDPHSLDSMTSAIRKGLTDPAHRTRLVENARKQRITFSWHGSAKKAIAGFEAVHASRQTARLYQVQLPVQRPTLAYVSPIPPAASGIADYSAEILPDLARFYDITVVTKNRETADASADPFVNGSLRVIDAAEFQLHAHKFDRVVYHMGNSDHHDHMFKLLEAVPGVVVLHDFYLSGILECMENHLGYDRVWHNALFATHGYPGLAASTSLSIQETVYEFASSLSSLEGALGVISHSAYSLALATDLGYGSFAQDWTVVPLARQARMPSLRDQKRDEPGFLLCSFGLMGRTKAVDRLVSCWAKSKFADDKDARLIFVGSRDNSAFGDEVDALIDELSLTDRVQITGRLSLEDFQTYLGKADGAVQLRQLSRGETSAAVLDCLAHGIPTIVNANGSMSELDPNAVLLLPDEFTDDDLVTALNRLHDDVKLRTALSSVGGKVLRTVHNPRRCAEQYAGAIERYYANTATSARLLTRKINELPGEDFNAAARTSLADAIVAATRRKYQDVVFVDVTALLNEKDRAFASEGLLPPRLAALLATPCSTRIEPVRWCDDSKHWVYARIATCALLGIQDANLEDEIAPLVAGDSLLSPSPEHRRKGSAPNAAYENLCVREIIAGESGHLPTKGVATIDVALAAAGIGLIGS